MAKPAGASSRLLVRQRGGADLSRNGAPLLSQLLCSLYWSYCILPISALVHKQFRARSSLCRPATAIIDSDGPVFILYQKYTPK